LSVAKKPRTFAELVGAIDPALRERIQRAQLYRDPAVQSDFHADVILQEDLEGNGEWRLEYQDDDGACYVTIFAGTAAERRARDYFNALKTGVLKTVRDRPSEH
jgi:hypothetical protein